MCIRDSTHTHTKHHLSVMMESVNGVDCGVFIEHVCYSLYILQTSHSFYYHKDASSLSTWLICYHFYNLFNRCILLSHMSHVNRLTIIISWINTRKSDMFMISTYAVLLSVNINSILNINIHFHINLAYNVPYSFY